MTLDEIEAYLLAQARKNPRRIEQIRLQSLSMWIRKRFAELRLRE